MEPELTGEGSTRARAPDTNRRAPTNPPGHPHRALPPRRAFTPPSPSDETLPTLSPLTTRGEIPTLSRVGPCREVRAPPPGPTQGDEDDELTTLTQEQQVLELLRSIETDDHGRVAYINSEKYILHNLAMADRLAGFGEVMSHLPKGSRGGRILFACSRTVTRSSPHTDYNFFGQKIGFDIFRFENGKIAEHAEPERPHDERRPHRGHRPGEDPGAQGAGARVSRRRPRQRPDGKASPATSTETAM